LIEQVSARAQSIEYVIANEVNHLQQHTNLIEHVTGNEINHLQQQANRERLFQHVSANEVICLHQQEIIEGEINLLHSLEDIRVNENTVSQRMNYEHENNRLTEYEILSSNHDEFKLRNPQLSMQEAVNFLNKKDPLQHKWSDFEKSPVKSLLLWYANAGCFAFDEYKEWHSMVSKWMSKDLKRKLAMKYYQIKSLEI